MASIRISQAATAAAHDCRPVQRQSQRLFDGAQETARLLVAGQQNVVLLVEAADRWQTR